VITALAHPVEKFEPVHHRHPKIKKDRRLSSAALSMMFGSKVMGFSSVSLPGGFRLDDLLTVREHLQAFPLGVMKKKSVFMGQLPIDQP